MYVLRCSLKDSSQAFVIYFVQLCFMTLGLTLKKHFQTTVLYFWSFIFNQQYFNFSVQTYETHLRSEKKIELNVIIFMNVCIQLYLLTQHTYSPLVLLENLQEDIEHTINRVHLTWFDDYPGGIADKKKSEQLSCIMQKCFSSPNTLLKLNLKVECNFIAHLSLNSYGSPAGTHCRTNPEDMCQMKSQV